MEAPEVEAGRQTCALHADRQAVGRCGECGRTVCLSCAIPFRGRVLCTACAARALGEPSLPEEPAPARSPTLDLWTGALLVAALVMTIPPWERFGSLTRPLSAWRAQPDRWPTWACLLLLAATVLLGVLALRARSGPLLGAAFVAVALLAVAATLRAILGSLDYVQHTPAPYAVLLLTAAAAGIGILRLVRARSPAAR